MIFTEHSSTVNNVVKDQNSLQLEKHFAWLEIVMHSRLDSYFGDKNQVYDIYNLDPPEIDPEGSMFASLLLHYEMTAAEKIAFLLALAPFIRPQILDVFFEINKNMGRGYTEFGGVKGICHGGFLPTAETVLFILAGDDLSLRLAAQSLFGPDHYFSSHNLVVLETAPPNEPRFSGQWILSSQILDLITKGEIQKPKFSQQFPAKLLTTPLDWDDLVLNEQTKEHLEELDAWMNFEQELMDDWGMSRILKPGFRCLFHGPSGTGKTLTAALLGKHFGKDVYRVDLSAVISKYIGETEKNLERIFERVEMLQCILFFDEADALFGKRTNVNEAHDRYANQEISYLLQRIEEFDGVVILASNFIGNMDDAFLRRFQSTVHFPMPDATERQKLWQQAFSDKAIFEDKLDFGDIGDRYKLSGGSIVNVVRYASLRAIKRRSHTILESDLVKGIRREFQKDGKLI